MPIRSIESNEGKVRISVDDDLTTTDLRLIEDALRSGPSGGHIQVDLRAARHVPPPQLLKLAMLLGDLGASYDLAGLSSSNQGLLRLLGVAARTDGMPS